MRYNMFIIILLFVTHLSQAQPTGEERAVMLHLTFTDYKSDTLSFYPENGSLVSSDKKYQVTCYINNVKDSTIKHIELSVERSGILRLFYYPAIQSLGKENFSSLQDVILEFSNKNKKMCIIFKLYNSQGLFDGGDEIYLQIPFKKGIFEVTDPKLPKLIPIKKGRE